MCLLISQFDPPAPEIGVVAQVLTNRDERANHLSLKPFAAKINVNSRDPSEHRRKRRTGDRRMPRDARAVSVGAIVRNAASVGYVWMAALESD